MWSTEITSSLAAIIVVGFLQSNSIQLHALLKRVIGSFIFLIPVAISIINQPNNFFKMPGFSFSIDWSVIAIVFSVIILMAVADYFMASDKENIENYPPIRSNVWSRSLLLKSTLTWAVFLVCYEMIFRGLFLFSTIEKIGLLHATLLNTVVCSLVHLMKSKREALMSIPVGLLLCYIAWKSGSFWYAAILHVALAIVHEAFSIASNPKMSFNFNTTKK